MQINGIDVPFVSVRREFFRNTAAYESDFISHRTRVSGVRRIWSPSPVDIPVVISRRDAEDLNYIVGDWEAVRQAIAERLFAEEIVTLSLPHDSERLSIEAQMLAFEITEWSEYSANGAITFMPLDSMWRTEEKSLVAEGTHNIKGNKSTAWRSKTTFTDVAKNYMLQFNTPGKTALREINKIVVNFNFVAGDVLEIDFSRRTIEVNGVDMSHTLSIINSNYTELPIGDVTFSASEETEIYYFERYY